MKIKITPLDNLFFRDGKPFRKGEDNWADTLYLPNLTTIYGAIRSKYFSENMNSFDLANTDEDPTKEIQVIDFNIMLDNSIVFPMPLDLIAYKDEIPKNSIDNKYTVHKMKSKKIENIYSSLHNKYNLEEIFVVEKDEKVQSLEGSYMDKKQIESYLYKSDKTFEVKKINNYIIEEGKIGIAKDDETKATKDSMLYRINQVRYKGISLVIEFNGIEIEKDGFLKLGGRGNIVKYESVKDKNDITDSKNKGKACNRLKLYLKTPAIFNKGWLPDFIDENSMKGKFNNLDVKLINAAIGKHKNIGGYDMKKNKPKAMKKAVPEGSVYVFEIENVKKESLVETVFLDSLNKNEGYGIAYAIYYSE